MPAPPELELSDEFYEFCAVTGRDPDDPDSVADWLDDLAYTAARDRIEDER